MKMRHFVLLATLTAIWAATAQAAHPLANIGDITKENVAPASPGVDKAFGDPTDLKAAVLAGASRVRALQSDITEDNAGNGDPDIDPEDGGWDWNLVPMTHSANASAVNLFGDGGLHLYYAYQVSNDPMEFIAMKDAADHLVSVGPASATPATSFYGPDITFLLKFAALPGVVNPAAYENTAVDMYAWMLTSWGGTPASIIINRRDRRHVSGYDNGIIGWDCGTYVEAAAQLAIAFPAGTYAADATAMANEMWNDSFALLPGYFDVMGRNMGFDPAWSTPDYYWYTLGVTGLLKAFAMTGTHAADLAALETVLHQCQYSDGAFSDQFGNDPLYNFRTYQTTAYGAMALARDVAASPANLTSLYDAGVWMATWQDVSGAWVYGGGNHQPVPDAETTAGIAMAQMASAAAVTAASSFADPAQCGVNGQVAFNFTRSAATPGIFGYEITVAISGPVNAVATTDFVQVAAMDYFQTIDNLDGTFTVNAARFGTDPGLLSDAELFHVNLSTAAAGNVALSVTAYRLRDPNNVSVFADMTGTGFTVDCTAPAAVTNLTTAPGHNKVDVNWAHDGLDTATYEIYRGLWYDTTPGVSAYPEYDDLAGNTVPADPADRDAAIASAEWVFAGSVSVGTTTFTDMWPDATSRGVYYYHVFAVDAAGNGSVAAMYNDRATNYWLGDVSAIDGQVSVDDITALGTAFATADGDVAYDNAIDVGPTDNWSGMGIPTTDSLIDFEDLMVFALNFGVVTPAKILLQTATVVDLAWQQRQDGRWALTLVNGPGLQGLRVRASLPAGVVGTVEAGELLTSQGAMPFLINTGSALDVNVALMGHGQSFVGNGELFVVAANADIDATALVIDARGADNSRLEFTLNNGGAASIPTAFRLGANFPNPFNPMTKISFSLPSTQMVDLAVYSLDGRRVATLLSETRSAGQHDIVWMGRDDAGQSVASGTYFYRLNAGPYSQVRKMTLMK